MASKESWGNFALKLHATFQQFPCMINRCEMLQISSEGFGERTKINFILPDVEWIWGNQAPEIFPNFYTRSNGTKYAIPLYLDLVLHQINRKKPAGEAAPCEIVNHFPTLVGPKKVQIILYGQNCVFPFRVNSK